MTQASIFMNNKTQAVRIPKAEAFPAGVKTVEVISQGRARLIVPTEDTWTSWFDQLEPMPDFLTDRDQPDDQERSEL